MKKEQLRENEDMVSAECSRKKRKKAIIGHISWTALVSLLVLGFYRISLSFPFFTFVMSFYMVALVALIVVYIIYNRGFTRLHVKEGELPENWTSEKKQIYIQNGEKRLHNSRWLLYCIIALIFTFLTDAFELFVISSILSWF